MEKSVNETMKGLGFIKCDGTKGPESLAHPDLYYNEKQSLNEFEEGAPQCPACNFSRFITG